MATKNVVGIKQKVTLNPILNLDGARVVAQANILGSPPIATFVGNSNVVAEATQVSTMSQILSSTSLNNIGECVLGAPVWSNVLLASSNVVCECIFTNYLAGGGTVAGGIDILDEGVLVLAGARHIDIVGADSRADLDGVGVKIWHPPPSYVSHFDTADGTTNGVVVDTATSSRYVATPTVEGTPFYAGAWAGTQQACSRTGILTWATPQDVSFNDLTGTFTISLTGPQGSIDSFTTAVISGNGVFISPSTDITVTVSGWAVDSDKYRASVSVQIDVNSALVNQSGRLDLTIQHNNIGDGTYIYTQPGWFFDTEPAAASLTGVTIAETVGFVVTKQLSGVYHYTTGSDFTIDIADIDNINADSFPANFVSATGTEYGLPGLSLSGADLTAWTNIWNNVNASYQKTDWEINAASFCSVSNTANISARTEDWVSGSWVNSGNASICVDTYTANSTPIYRDFRDENYRFTSAWAAWDSTQNLNAYDDNLGLQVQCSRLIYPSLNFTTYSPLPGSQPDYSASAGTRTYFTEFYHTGTAHSAGIIQLGDYTVTEADITADNWLLEISLDNINWYNVNEDYLGGALGNGDGCRIDTGVYNLTANNRIRFTLGTGGFSGVGTGPSGWGIYVRLSWTVAMAAKYCGSIEIVDWI